MSNNICRVAATTIVALLAVSVPSAMETRGEPPTAPMSPVAIQSLLRNWVDRDKRAVGIVVGIVTPYDRLVVAHGHLGVDDPRPLDGDTVFEIGSVTKVFTSLLLADLVQRGEVALDDPVARYLPTGVRLASSGPRSVTLSDLATHTSGLPFWPAGIPTTADGVRAMGDYSVDRLYEYLSTVDVPADVGSRWGYSNVDAGVLGLALARRAGTGFVPLLTSRVIAPLSLTSTAVTPSAEMTRRLAVGHDKKLSVAPRWRVPALEASGSLHSTVNDQLTFLAAVAGHASSPLRAAMDSMLAVRRPGPGFQQALGWWIFADGEDQFVTHVGGTLGFASQIGYDPHTRVGVVVLSNAAHAVSEITRQVLRPGRDGGTGGQ